MYAFPGVWKDMPQLNDIRVGLGRAMDYDSVREQKAMEIMEKLQKHYDRLENEEKGTEQT